MEMRKGANFSSALQNNCRKYHDNDVRKTPYLKGAVRVLAHRLAIVLERHMVHTERAHIVLVEMLGRREGRGRAGRVERAKDIEGFQRVDTVEHEIEVLGAAGIEKM